MITIRQLKPGLFLLWLILVTWGNLGLRTALAGEYPEADWGIAVAVRSSTIPFATDEDVVNSFVPMLFYDGELFFLDGVEGGVKLLQADGWRLELLGKLRFFDIPKQYQNAVQGDTFDFGFRFRYEFSDRLGAEFELLGDPDGRLHGDIQFGHKMEFGKLELEPYLNYRLTGGNFNSHYYGLDRQDLGSGSQWSLGVEGKYHIWSNLYGIGRLQTSWLGSGITASRYLDRSTDQELYLGIGFFPEASNERKPSLTIHPYLRLAHGWATPSSLRNIIRWNSETDEYNNQLTSLFFGYPLTDELFSLPLAIFTHTGFVHHWSSEVQSSIPEVVVAIKAYYSFHWPVTWRFGAAEGISYVADIPYVEKTSMERKEYEPSNLMNYLDFSLDLHLGDLLPGQIFQNWYIGYSIHHRSSIFESASHFGRIKGGSNFNTIYLQYHF